MSNNLLSLAGWTFLPNLVTGWIQALYYGITIRAGDPKPQPGSPRYVALRRRIHIIVISAYLLYTIYEADWEIRRDGDFYRDLGVSIDATERDIKSRFRRLAAIYHPDKIAASPTSQDHFVHLKTAQDTLLNPAKRFAYERFGPDVLGWQRCSSIRDYVTHGLTPTLSYYGGAAIVMYILGMLGYLDWGKFWRWLTLISLCTFELHAISRPHFPLIATHVLNPILGALASHPPYLPFQLISLGRKLSLTLFIAFSQIGPLLQPPTQTPAGVSPEALLKAHLDRLDNTANAANIEAMRLLEMELAPFAGDPKGVKDIQVKVKDWLITNTIRNDPMVRDALGTELKKRRTDAPAGAKGNR